MAQSEGDVQQASSIGAAQGMEADLLTAMPFILQDQQRLVNENLLGLDLADPVLINGLATVALVPVKRLDPRPTRLRGSPTR
jgi:hypothetical protein